MSTVTSQVLAALEAHGLKDEGGGSYRCNSPFRPNSDGMSFTVTIRPGDKGAYYDHNSQATGDEQRGSLFKLAKLLGIEVRTTEVENTKRTYANMEEYAKAHGITVDVLKKFMWKQVVYQNRPALEFPTRTGSRWRFLDGKKPHYISPKGYKKSWYGLFSRLTEKRVKHSPLVICNGEISTIVGQEFGLAACAMTGGEMAIPDDLMAQLKGFTEDVPDIKIIIALDCDAAGRKTAIAMIEQLQNAGYPDVKAIDLGLSKGGDLADYCMLHGDLTPLAIQKCTEIRPPQQQQVEVPQECVIAEGTNWYMIHAKDLDKLPQVEWLIKGELQRRGLTVLYGPSGVGKSFIAVDYAMRIAQDHPVVYMAMEGEYGYHARLTAWKNHHKKESAGNIHMCLGSLEMMSDSELDHFLSATEPINPELVVIDTMVHAMTGADENNTRDMNTFVRSCKKLMYALSCSLLIVHHTNKGGISERGSGVLRGAADVMIRLLADDGLITMECSKTKDYRAFEPRYLRLLPTDTGIRDNDGEFIRTPVVVDAKNVIMTDEGKLTTNQQKVLETLAMEVFENGATLSELADALPTMARSSIFHSISHLIKERLVSQPAKRQPYIVTETGYEKLGKSNLSKKSNTSNDDTGIGQDENQPVDPIGQVGQVGQVGQPEPSDMFTGQGLEKQPMNHYEGGL